MKIFEGIEIIDLGIYLRKEKILVISDIQLGYEETLQKKGILIPRFQFSDIMQRLSKLVDSSKPTKIIINGDIKHEFGIISKSEWRQVLDLLEFLKNKAETILIKGNHDQILEPIADKMNLRLVDHILIGTNYICHGHEIPKNNDFNNSRLVIIGHEHPAIALKDNGRTEKFKCFLKGRYEDKVLIVQPSFNPITDGTDVLIQKHLSPFLTDISKFQAYVVADKIRDFGRLQDINENINYS